MARKQRHSHGIWHYICQFSTQLTTAMQCIAALMLGASAGSVYVSPDSIHGVSILGLGFPFFLAFAVLVGCIALLFTPRRSWISLVGLLACCGSIRNYSPINLPSEPPAEAWHVMTWNLGGVQWDDSSRTALKEYIQRADLDIACFQEICPTRSDTLAQALRYRMPYSSFSGKDDGGTGISILSRWPIIGVDTLSDHGANRAQAYTLLLAPGDTLFVVNVHMESMHIPHETRTDYSAIVHREQTNRDTVETISKTLLQHIAENSAIRSHQADSVADYIRHHAGQKILVMGDFNDTPISYTRQTLYEAAPLTDCWRATGTGIARTFNRNAFYVRIDHIFCSSAHFVPYQCRIDHSKLSDHYPVDTYIGNITTN